jgi:hypothetical protein
MKSKAQVILDNIILGVAEEIIRIRKLEKSDRNDGKLQAYCNVLSLAGCSYKRIKNITGIELIKE